MLRNGWVVDHIEPKVHPHLLMRIDPVPGQIFRLLYSLGPSSMTELIVLGPTKMLRLSIIASIIGVVVIAMTTVVIRIASRVSSSW